MLELKQVTISQSKKALMRELTKGAEKDLRCKQVIRNLMIKLIKAGFASFVARNMLIHPSGALAETTDTA